MTDEPFTDDELTMLSDSDKNEAPAADAGDTETVPDEQDDPLAAGVDADRATRWAIHDAETGAYVPGSVRLRPPTAKMRDDVASDNAAVGFDRYVWHRV